MGLHSLMTALAGGVALSALASGAALADGEAATSVDDVTVTATRTEARVDEVPATVTVIDEQEIEGILATDIKDVIRFEPGVSVPTQPTRFSAALSPTGRDGNSGFNIRGMGGNRVLIQVDGVRVPDGFSFGAQAVGRGDYVDLDLLKSIEILRGPASALYGSDGLAGAVSFVTRDPEDMLDERDFAIRARGAYASADDSFSEGVSLAGRSGDWSGLIAYTRRDARETETQGDNNARNAARTTANPQDITSDSVMGRIVYAPSDEHRFRLTAEHFKREVETEAYSARSVPPLAATSVIDLDALDTTSRDRVAFDYRFENAGGLIDRAQVSVYWQQSETREYAEEDRNTAADRVRDNTFDNQVWGVSAQGESSFEWMGVPHRLIYGADYSTTRQEGIRDGVVAPVGETFPTRSFPNTDYALAGVFIQDEISLMGGALRLYPAVRFDAYELEPEADALYPLPPEGSDDSHISPKFGVVYWSESGVGFFLNYAEGFKAPRPSEVNNGFSNPVFGYTSIANPNLRPETSRTFEGGVRVRDIELAGASWSAQATAFTGRYEDFIEQVALAGPLPAACGAFALCFQYVNLGEVEISGFEARIEAQWENGFNLNAAFSSARGDAENGGVEAPLESVDPFKAVVGLGYNDPAGRFGGQAIVTHSADKDASRAAPTSLLTDSFTLLDVTAYWRVTDTVTLRAGAFNITDETYAWWSDVRGMASTTTVADAYTQPGRNFSVSLTFKY